ncbi:ABC transporter ATP-binding protein [Streptomyces cinnamoneus]|uniref:ABC transporter ATP-binding protein n=1 Tax=Streptomyces cinnamoneus TaxID=53446 RepID=A0A2G1XG84_STRCJ|nr:ABC transporter ATP-binding protein [Streptomyces cinnamoneus]PHQ50237.1 ABC transporter ATP-binding protein [Streptomyces cinnamoneus]PPT12978.1 ABC transporter ATP-binding protein [Streptomyces cinnamoneus]
MAVTAPHEAGEDARAGDRILAGAVRHSAARTLVLALIATAGTGAALLSPAVLGHTLDLLLARRGDTTRWVLLCAGLVCAPAALDALDELLGATTTARTTAWLRHRALGHVLAAGPAATAAVPPGDLVSRVVGNAAHAAAAPASLAGTVTAVVGPLGGVVALGLIDPWLVVVFLAGAPLLALLLRAFARASTDSLTAYQRLQGDLAGRLLEAVGGARTIAAAGTAGRERARVLAPLPGLSRHGHRMWRVQGRSTAQAVTLVPLLQIAVLAVAGLELHRGRLSVGDVLAASRYAALATGVGMIVGHVNTLVHSRTAARRLAGVHALPAVRHGSRRLPPGDGTLRLRGVSARRGGRQVLSDVDLVVPGGTTLAVVGRSGTGKSVLAELAGRLADPDTGEVTLDGVPLPDLAHDELRREVGYAFARPALLGGTIGGTIGFGSRTPAPHELTAAARAACADGFIRKLPAGYATPCAAAPLSGGEAQRLGLARAFAHAGRLLVLDDATSSLDSVTEHEVARALVDDVTAGTRVIVAHRATTAARADRVAWLDAGRVRAVGTHGELWRLPAYRAVFGE